MEQKIIFTPLEAWHDFYKWVRQQPDWAGMERKERLRIYEANAAAKGQRAGALGYGRIRDILSRYAPGRYKFVETVILVGK